MLISDLLSYEERRHLGVLTIAYTMSRIGVEPHEGTSRPNASDLADIAVACTLVPEDRRGLDRLEESDGQEPSVVRMHGDAAWCAALLAQVVASRGAPVVARQVVGDVYIAAYVLHERAFKELRLDDEGLLELAAQREQLAAEEAEGCRLRGEFEGAVHAAQLVAQVLEEQRAAARSVVNQVLLSSNPCVVHAVFEGVVHGIYADPAVAAQVARQHKAELRSVSVYVPGVLVVEDDGEVSVGPLLVDPDEGQ